MVRAVDPAACWALWQIQAPTVNQRNRQCDLRRRGWHRRSQRRSARSRVFEEPREFARLGGRIPRGVLLAGPPVRQDPVGAIAGEADVPASRSVGLTLWKCLWASVRAGCALFKQAKESSPCIIFLDEIDAVGRKRGSGFSSGGHDEPNNTERHPG